MGGKIKFVYSWRLEPTDTTPQGKKPGPSLRELEKQIGRDLDSLLDPTQKNMTVLELVERYLATKTGVRPNTLMNYNFVVNLLQKEEFALKKISEVKTSDAKLFLIKLQQDGKGYSTRLSRLCAGSFDRLSRWQSMMICSTRTPSALNLPVWW